MQEVMRANQCQKQTQPNKVTGISRNVELLLELF